MQKNTTKSVNEKLIRFENAIFEAGYGNEAWIENGKLYFDNQFMITYVDGVFVIYFSYWANACIAARIMKELLLEFDLVVGDSICVFKDGCEKQYLLDMKNGLVIAEIEKGLAFSPMYDGKELKHCL